MDDNLRMLKSTLDSEIGKIAKKDTISPAELENITKALCAVEQIKRIEGMQDEYSRGYSYGHDRSYARGRDADTGRYVSRDNYGGRSGLYHDVVLSGDMLPEEMREMYRSGAINRERMNDGRYRYIKDSQAYEIPRGMSGHSIKDRMIDRLERMMDEAQTDHERQTVQEWIDRLTSQN